jgi:hypothetical protein
MVRRPSAHCVDTQEFLDFIGRYSPLVENFTRVLAEVGAPTRRKRGGSAEPRSGRGLTHAAHVDEGGTLSVVRVFRRFPQ